MFEFLEMMMMMMYYPPTVEPPVSIINPLELSVLFFQAAIDDVAYVSITCCQLANTSVKFGKRTSL